LLGESVSVASAPCTECVVVVESLRERREAPERPLLPDLTDAASPSPLDRMAEFLGLSAALLEPGILDRRGFLKDRRDSFVSDLLKEGYACSESPGPDDLEPEPESLELELPMVRMWQKGFQRELSIKNNGKETTEQQSTSIKAR
jgi:hypothetical protein